MARVASATRRISLLGIGPDNDGARISASHPRPDDASWFNLMIHRPPERIQSSLELRAKNLRAHAPEIAPQHSGRPLILCGQRATPPVSHGTRNRSVVVEPAPFSSFTVSMVALTAARTMARLSATLIVLTLSFTSFPAREPTQTTKRSARSAPI